MNVEVCQASCIGCTHQGYLCRQFEYLSDEDIPEEIKEKFLKEYAKDLFEEFQQIDRFEGKITLKDVTDVLQLGEEK